MADLGLSLRPVGLRLDLVCCDDLCSSGWHGICAFCERNFLVPKSALASLAWRVERSSLRLVVCSPGTAPETSSGLQSGARHHVGRGQLAPRASTRLESQGAHLRPLHVITSLRRK